MATKKKDDTDDFGAKQTKMFDLEYRTKRIEEMLTAMVERGLIEKWDKQGDEDSLLYHVYLLGSVRRVMRVYTTEAFLLGAITAGADI